MKYLFNLKIALMILLLCGSVNIGAAQSKGGKTTFSGYVYAIESESGGVTTKPQPLSYATVYLPEVGLFTTTGEDGYFEMADVDSGIYTVEISSLGYEDFSQQVELTAQSGNFSFTLKATSFYLEEVTVSAETKKTGASTASKISRAAMEHLQATSLADVMSLLPGAVTRESEDLMLSKASTFSVRGGSSFGTSVIMDGAPVSNNANMQSVSMAMGQSDAGLIDDIVSPSTGIDLRTITTNNVESVEVIRGIASAQYGDIASGAVIINSKAGVDPFSVKMDLNPNMYMVAVSHGFRLGDKAGVLNYGGDYTYSQFDLRQGYDTYNRVTARAAYSNNIGIWSTNTSLNVFYAYDKGEPNPDDENDFMLENQKDIGFMFNTNGVLGFDKGWFKNIRYTGSVNYTNKKTIFSERAISASTTYSTSETDGAILSSFPGVDIYDEEGNKVTNIGPEDMEHKAWMLPNSYDYEYRLLGKELTTFLQASALFSGNLGATRHRILVGADYRTSGNLGDGKVFDPNNPPMRVIGENFATQRERAFKDVPFMHHLGLYVEENFSLDVLKRKLEIMAGVRYDKVFGIKGDFAPRINASYEIIPNYLRIRGGYGITLKAPSLGYLYPDNAYFDILNFNNAEMSGFSDAQKFQLATTRVFSGENPDLELQKTDKWEVGLDFEAGQIRGSITYFEDKSTNGYMLSRTFDSFKSVDYIQYDADVPANETDLPVLTVAEKEKILLDYRLPTNYSAYENKGVEFDIDFGRIDAIRTSFGLNGAWNKYKSWTNYYTFNNDPGGSTTAELYPHMGVFEPGNTVDHSETVNTNFRITHNIPSIGFVVTLTAGVTWYDRSYNTYGNDSIPVMYINRLDGKVYDFDPSVWEDEELYKEFAALDIRDELNSRRHIKEGAMPPLLCMNINVTKEIKDFLRISFFANNMFRSMPLWESKKTPGNFTRRNEGLFFFGASLSFTLK